MSGRRQPPNRRASAIRKVRLGGQAVFVGYSVYPDGDLADLWLDTHRTGTSLRGLMSTLARLVSLALQHGVPPDALAETLAGLQYPPCGPVTGHPEIRHADSLADLVAQELRYLCPS